MTEAYTGIAPNRNKLRRFQGVGEDPQSPDPQTSHDSDINSLRSYLDSVFNIADDPYTSWKQKREWIENDSRRQRPNITDGQLDQIYKAYGLSRSPGDFDRGDDTWGAFSRSMDMASESMGQLVDVAQMKLAAKLGDDAGVAENQRQLDESRWEQSLIAQFQSEKSNGPISQFLFDLSSSAPLMVGMVAGGAVLAGAASLVGAPAWLAGLLGYGVIDALTEGSFTFIDIVTDPHVRGKIEKALGRQMSDNDIKAISKETQKILMDRAADADDTVKIINFMNPLNYVPFANKLNKLFKAGSAMKGTVLRGATNVAFREGIEEVGQSAVSQKFAGEAKIDLLTRYGEDPDPSDYDIDWGQAFYEGAMGFVTGAPIGMVSSYRSGKAYKEGRANIDEETGQLIYKDKNQEGFVGTGPLHINLRSIIDSNLTLDDKLRALDEYVFNNKDGRQAEIISKEIQRMKEGKPLMFDKSNPEKTSRRQQVLAEYKKGTHFDPTKDADGKLLEDGTVGQEPRYAEPDHQEEGRKIQILSEISQSPGIQAWMKRFLNIPKNDRTPFQKQYIQFALDPANKEMNAQDLFKKTNQRINELTIPDKYSKTKSELAAEEKKISEISGKQGRFDAADETLKAELKGDTTATEEVEQAPEVVEKVETTGAVPEEVVEEVDITSPIITTTSTRQAGETVPEEAPAEGDTAAVETAPPTISDKITDKSKTRTEIINTWKEWWKESGREPKTDEEWRQLNSDISTAVNNYGKDNYETKIKTRDKDSKEYEDWDFTPDGRLVLARDLAEEHDIPIPPLVEGQQTTFPGTATDTSTPTSTPTGPEAVEATTEGTTETQPDEKPIEPLYNTANEEVSEVLSIADVMNKTVMHFTPNKTNRGASWLLTTDQYDAAHRGADKVKEPTEKMSRNDYNMTRYTFTV